MKKIFIYTQYFSQSGKFKYEGSGEIEIPEKLKHQPKHIGEYARENKLLPGLVSGKWDYYFIISIVYENQSQQSFSSGISFPTLILPEGTTIIT